MTSKAAVKSPKMVEIQIDLTPATKKKIEKIAKLAHVSINDVIVVMLTTCVVNEQDAQRNIKRKAKPSKEEEKS